MHSEGEVADVVEGDYAGVLPHACHPAPASGPVYHLLGGAFCFWFLESQKFVSLAVPSLHTPVPGYRGKAEWLAKPGEWLDFPLQSYLRYFAVAGQGLEGGVPKIVD